MTAVLLGQSAEDIIAMMVEQGIFHILTTMLMYVPTTEVTSACLGRLAGTSDSAAHEAQVPHPIMLATLTQLCKLLSHQIAHAWLQSQVCTSMYVLVLTQTAPSCSPFCAASAIYVIQCWL